MTRPDADFWTPDRRAACRDLAFDIDTDVALEQTKERHPAGTARPAYTDSPVAALRQRKPAEPAERSRAYQAGHRIGHAIGSVLGATALILAVFGPITLAALVAWHATH